MVTSRGLAGLAAYARLAPDGQSIAAIMGGLAGASAHAVVEIRVDTGDTREILRAGTSERIPVWEGLPWTPDGRAVLVRKRVPNELWLVPTTGAPPRKLDVDVKDWNFGVFGVISLHPDGRQIAATAPTLGATNSEVMVLENFLPKTKTAKR